MAPRAYWKGSLKLSLVTCIAALSGDHRGGEDPLPSDQQGDWQATEAADGRF